MDVIELKQKLEEAFEKSKKSYNRFKEFVTSLNWDYSFYADGEYYFVKDNITFTTPLKTKIPVRGRKQVFVLAQVCPFLC